MADIELVIKMTEEEYKNICLMSKAGIGMALYDWIANGTPLPKGHGRLVDADAQWLDNHNGTVSCSSCHTWFYKSDRYSYMRYCPYCNVKIKESD